MKRKCLSVLACYFRLIYFKVCARIHQCLRPHCLAHIYFYTDIHNCSFKGNFTEHDHEAFDAILHLVHFGVLKSNKAKFRTSNALLIHFF